MEGVVAVKARHTMLAHKQQCARRAAGETRAGKFMRAQRLICLRRDTTIQLVASNIFDTQY
jgi:hypothetical protein